MRASMAVPALVAPLKMGDRLLIDGGLVRNLPIDVARSMGADIIIAVNLGTPLLKPDQILGLQGVSMQTLGILTEQNVRQSLQQLRAQDVLIEPDLGDFSAADFDNLMRTVPIGEAAARAAEPTAARAVAAARGLCGAAPEPAARSPCRRRRSSPRSTWPATGVSIPRSCARTCRRKPAGQWTRTRSTWTCAASTAPATSRACARR